VRWEINFIYNLHDNKSMESEAPVYCHSWACVWTKDKHFTRPNNICTSLL